MPGRCRENLAFGDSGIFGEARRKQHVWRKGTGAREGNWLGGSHLCLHSSSQDSVNEDTSRT